MTRNPAAMPLHNSDRDAFSEYVSAVELSA